MSAKSISAIAASAVSFVGILFTISSRAQNVSAPSLADQLKTQYKLVKLSADSNIAEEGTVLVIHGEGIFGVPAGSTYSCPSMYVDGALHAPSADDKLHCGKEFRELKTGEKVYPLRIDVDTKKNRVSLLVVECGSCNGLPQSASYKALVVFQYPNGYMAAAEVSQIEDVINQVVPIDSGTSDPEPRQNDSSGLTNSDIIKLAKAKLPDSVIIAKIKSSSCDFDTSTDALIKLKQAGVSDSVLQAMVEAPPPKQPEETKPSEPNCSDYPACISSGNVSLGSAHWDDALAAFQAASSLDGSKADAWEGMGNAHLGATRMGEATAMWDKALVAGGPLTFPACHIRGFNTCEWGNLILGPKNVSFTLSAGQQLFAAQPTQVLSPHAYQYPAAEGQASPQIVVLSLKAGGKNYRFHMIPFGVACNSGPTVVRVVCPDEGSAQAFAISNYISQAIPKLASGALAGASK